MPTAAAVNAVEASNAASGSKTRMASVVGATWFASSTAAANAPTEAMPTAIVGTAADQAAGAAAWSWAAAHSLRR
ncbi:Uncharacterised protein [Mycobacteroides abscessus subsp. abscessus]|nr:Uncharacterised protein [Mycobacteroides abscessus]SHX56184.1 Uncharacterised protein [Mycobacteroides abscessus subsp. abscessus]